MLTRKGDTAPFYPAAKKPVFLKYENSFEKNSHLNLNFVEVPTFFHKVIRIVRPFFIPGIHRRSSCRTWASRSARRTGSIWIWPNLPPKQTWLFIQFWHFYYNNSYLFFILMLQNYLLRTFLSSVVDPDSDLHGSSLVLAAGFGSRRATITHKNIKMWRNLIFLKCWMFSLTLWHMWHCPLKGQ